MPISKGENLQLLQFDVSGGSETRQPLGVAQCKSYFNVITFSRVSMEGYMSSPTP